MALLCKRLDDLSIYNLLVEEVQTCGVDEGDLFKLWHGPPDKPNGNNLPRVSLKLFSPKNSILNY